MANAKNYSTMEVGAYAKLGEKGRTMAGESLGLTGCEISFNSMPAGAGKDHSFRHTHKMNEEVYIVISGSGMFKVDDDMFPIQEGSVVRVAPAGVRSMSAGDDGLTYICIQAQAGSLTQATHDDGVIQS